MRPSHPELELPERLPVMPLRSTIVYPLGVIGVQIGMQPTLEMLAAYPEDVLLVALAVAPGGPDEPIEPRSLEKIGVVARLSDRLNLPGGTIQATIQGIQRVRLKNVEPVGGYFTTGVEAVEELPIPDDVAEDLIARVLTALEALAEEVERISREVPAIVRMNVTDPGRFADLVATMANFSVASKDEVVQRLDLKQRLTYILEELEGHLRRVRQVEESAEAEPKPEVQAAVSPFEHAANLRHKIKLLQAELGEVDPAEREAIELIRRIDAADLPTRVAAQARSEVERLRAIGATGIEASDIRSYLDWVLHIPWGQRATGVPEAIDLAAVQKAMDDEHLGLDEPKERLLDYLAVAKLRGDLRGPIPCLVGPPDSGKTSMAVALARGLGRPLARLELGGRGESQLIGTRRTRTGAHPGKILGALRDVGVRDPVFLLEEMDEIGLGKVDGDPIEAMEEALDWESRATFVDRYLDLPFDLTDTLFLATAQDFYRVPRDLRELMVEIRIAGYTPEEKVAIVRERMLPRMVAEHGLGLEDIDFDDAALFYLARNYSRDAGLGMMSRNLATLLRTRARAKAQGDLEGWAVTPERVEAILGLPRYIATAAEIAPEIGVVTGLAWTAAGGELMFIEALRMPGSGRLIITGLLGDVMRESVNAAYSYVRSRSDALGIPEEVFRDADVHVHFPVGAIPKDGPSAGIAVTLAIASTLSNRSVRHDMAMTGEVTLRGKVLEIGGVKEKVLAAYRAGLRHVILPRGNERDLRDVPSDVREKIRFEFVDRMDDVVRLALLASGPSELVPGEVVVPAEAPAPKAAARKRPKAAKEVRTPQQRTPRAAKK
ncbi:MAG: LON peptidase substrate-binding domain-containing protein [Gemmatimonadetes bacterium]|nr:LON peptidase substrate-binding domain-containing protein [Gemmatimonadota bacterium]